MSAAEPAEDTEASFAMKRPVGRVDRWKDRLLDLSLRNRLLNFRETSAALRLLSPSLGTLEDALAVQVGHAVLGDHEVRGGRLTLEPQVRDPSLHERIKIGRLCQT